MLNVLGFRVLFLRFYAVGLLFVTMMLFVSRESAGKWRWVFFCLEVGKL